MKNAILAIGAALLLAVCCRQPVSSGRDMLDSVKAIAADTAGVFSEIAAAGQIGAKGTIAIVGEPGDGLLLSRRFLTMDQLDNIDGRPVRDSLPDFSGETFQVLLDEYNAPYAHFLSYQDGVLVREGLDSLRALAVQHAVYAWKKDSKMLIFTSSLQAEYGLFDVDTLRAMARGKTVILSPLETMLSDALELGARRIAVWAPRDLRQSGVYEAVFSRMAPEDASIEVITPDTAMDVRTELRNLLRQYQMRSERLDALLIDSYSVNLIPLQSELKMIRRKGTEEDEKFNRMLSSGFQFIDAASSVTQAAVRILREDRLFTHRIALPQVRYFLTVESEEGGMSIVEAGSRFVQETYVPDFD